MTHLSIKPRFVFIHIPKNAGAAFSRAIESETCTQFNRAHTHTTLEMVLARHPEFCDAPVIAIFRNPWERLWSLYNFRRARLHRRIELRAKGKSVKRASNDATDRRHLDEMNRLGFNRWLIEADPVNGHNSMSQLAWADSPHLISLQFGNLANEIGRLSHLLPHLKLPQTNLTNYTHYDFRDNYSREARELVDRVYAPDVERFGYCFDDTPTPQLSPGWPTRVVSSIRSALGNPP